MLTEGWLAGETLGHRGTGTRGAEVLLVDDSRAITPGEMVLLEIDRRPDLEPPDAARDGRRRRRRVCRIHGTPRNLTGHCGAGPSWSPTMLSPRHVRLQQPLRVTIHPETPARLAQLGPSVYDSGVEGLTIENRCCAQTAHNVNPGSNGVCFQAVHDCWATDVHVLNADVAFSMTSGKSCTLCAISAGGRSLHHFTITGWQSHDNLVEDFVLEDFTVPARPGRTCTASASSSCRAETSGGAGSCTRARSTPTAVCPSRTSAPTSRW